MLKDSAPATFGNELAERIELLATIVRSSRCARMAPSPRLDSTLEVVHDCFNQRLSLGDIAESVGVHPAHLARAFRKRYGCSVGNYVRRLRVNFAADELRSGDHSLSQVALKAGFYDQAHFNRCFKRKFGIPPGVYRATYRGRP